MQLIDYCDNNNITFISDEIYHGLVYNKKEETALQYSDNAIVINGFSKSFCMPGFRVGWMIVPETMVRQSEIIIQNLFISANTPAQYAACSAFDYPYLETVKNTFQERRDFLFAELSKIFTITASPDGAFYIWADISHYSNDSFKFAQDLLEKEHVAITPGIDFGSNNTNRFVRFAYTRTVEELQEGVRRIKRFLTGCS